MKSSKESVKNLSILMILLFAISSAVSLEPYGPALDTELHCDDCSSGNVIPNGYSIIYYGESYTKMYVSSNGMLALGSEGIDVLSFSSKRPIIAPFMINIDTGIHNEEVDGTVFYRTEVEAQPSFDSFVNNHFGVNFFTAYKVVVTYENVRTKEPTLERNTFQAAIYVSHYGDTSVCFNYLPNGLNWPNILSTEFPIVGFYSGSELDLKYYLPGSNSYDAAHLDQLSNTGVEGQFCYLVNGLEIVDTCTITDIGCREAQYFPINVPIAPSDVIAYSTLCSDQSVDYNPKILTCNDLNQLVAVTTTVGDDEYCSTYLVPYVNTRLGFQSCPSNIVVHSSTATTANWIPPTPIGECALLDSLFVSHFPNSSLFTLGTTVVTYIIYDTQYNSAVCSFEVTVNPVVSLKYYVRDAHTLPMVGAAVYGNPDCMPTNYLGFCTVEAPQYHIGDIIPAGDYNIVDISGNLYTVRHPDIYVDCYNVEIELVLSPPGFYRSSSGDIFPCVPGTYSDTYEASHCISCPAGTFNNDEHDTRCDLCPPGYTSDEGAIECYACEGGYYLHGNKCVACPSGTYSCDRSISCEVCPTGSFSYEGAERCEYCSSGYYLNSTLSSCEPCPANTFSLDRASECIPCPSGFFATEGSTQCSYCSAGFYYDSTSVEKCTACPAGTYSTERSTDCLPCPPGGYSSAGATHCYFCSAGYYRNSSNLYVCDGDCDTCEPCPVGTFSCDRAETCEVCPPGTWSLPASPNCFSCDAGSYLDIESVQCELCPPNTYSSDRAFECLPCPEGSYSFGGASECYYCVSGYYYNSNTLACEVCPAGTFSKDRASECTPCTPGSYSFAGSDICMFCTAGYYLDDVSDSCLPCPSGTYSCDRATQCEICPEGSFSYPGSPSCTFCDAGYVFEPISQTCVPCPAGFYSHDRASVCTPCPDGFYSFSGSNACYACSAGFYMNEQGECLQCAPGFTSGDRAIECIEIPVLPIEENIHCTSGFYLDIGSNTCNPCPENYFSNDRAIECIPCPAGSYSMAGSSSCLFCEAGYYLDIYLRFCAPCPPNTFSSDRATECIPCGENQYSPEASSTCHLCPHNMRLNPQSGHCEACPHDSFLVGNLCVSCSDWEVPAECELCPPGNEIQVECQECYPGYFSPTGNKCIPCPDPDTYSGFGFSYCEICGDGYFWDYRYHECKPDHESCSVCDEN